MAIKNKLLGPGFFGVDELLELQVLQNVKTIEFYSPAAYYDNEKQDLTPGIVVMFDKHKFNKQKVLLDRFIKGDIKNLVIRIKKENDATNESFERFVCGIKTDGQAYMIFWLQNGYY